MAAVIFGVLLALLILIPFMMFASRMSTERNEDIPVGVTLGFLPAVVGYIIAGPLFLVGFTSATLVVGAAYAAAAYWSTKPTDTEPQPVHIPTDRT